MIDRSIVNVFVCCSPNMGGTENIKKRLMILKTKINLISKDDKGQYD